MNTLCLLTPPGRSAIATLSLRGPDAWSLTSALFRPHSSTQKLSVAQPGAVHVGYLGDGGGLADQVVLGVKAADCVEIHCHGGPLVIGALQELFARHAVVTVSPAEQESFSGEPLWKSQVRDALARTDTLRTAAVALDQLQGAWQRLVDEVGSAQRSGNVGRAQELCRRALGWERLGRHVVTPWKVLVAGAPNVGKSSLVNAMAGFERSIVSPVAGTTRDVLAVRIALDGWPVELHDTAGWRDDAAGALEAAGMTMGEAAQQDADLVLWVVDAGSAPRWPARQLSNLQVVVNKCDLSPAWNTATPAGAIHVSARTGQGLDVLCAAISRTLVPSMPTPGEAVPIVPEMLNWLREITA